MSNLLSIHKNRRKGDGKHYHPSTIKLFEVLQNFAGSATDNFLNKYLLDPALNTEQSNFQKQCFLYSIGINEDTFIYMSSMLKVGSD